MSNNDLDVKPWYRQFWPWFLIAFPLTAVIAGLSTVAIALSTHDGVVEDEYYKEGLAINVLKSRRQLAQAMQLSANLSFDWSQRSVVMQISSAKLDATTPDDLVLLLSHPTRRGFDICVNLRKLSNGDYLGYLPTPVTAYWHVFVRDIDSTWRLAGRYHLPAEAKLELLPG